MSQLITSDNAEWYRDASSWRFRSSSLNLKGPQSLKKYSSRDEEKSFTVAYRKEFFKWE
jgi:hypothetical protein